VQSEPDEAGAGAGAGAGAAGPGSIVHLAGSIPGKKFAAGSDGTFEVIYRLGEPFDQAILRGAARYMLTAFPVGTTLSQAGRPQARVDYNDPASIWAVFAYNGATFDIVRGVDAFPEPPPIRRFSY
jgi:hypothetical protein